MAVPNFQTLLLPLLELAGDGQQHTSAEAVESLAQRFQLSTDDRGQQLQNGQPRFNNRIGWATTYLKKAGLLHAVGRGRFELTDRGRDVLATNPDVIDVAFLESRFPEVVEFTRGAPHAVTAKQRECHEAPARCSQDSATTGRSN